MSSFLAAAIECEEGVILEWEVPLHSMRLSRGKYTTVAGISIPVDIAELLRPDAE
jgi:hypothetical protein